MVAAELAKLDAASGYRLILILDPSGVRKDAMLQKWIYHQTYPFAWIRLDHSDNELVSFIPHLRACMGSTGLFPTALPLQDECPTWEDCLTATLNAAIDVPQDFFLILDDFHNITSPDIHRALGWMLDYIPEQMHLLITSRQPFPLPVPRLRMRRQVLEIVLG